MKRMFTLFVTLLLFGEMFGQTDTTGKRRGSDTIYIGSMIIIRKQGEKGNREVIIGNKKDTARRYYSIGDPDRKPRRISTNLLIVDIGFASFNDKTNYVSADAQSFAPGGNKNWFKIKNGRSRNVNVWFFMQKLNIASRVLNLKYGLGLELNNYHFENDLRFQKNPNALPNPPRATIDATPDRNYEKNKLAADYLTVPVMLNFNFTPQKRKDAIGFSAGVSAGYLYNSRQKTITSDEGKRKLHDDFDLRKWKISYIAEVSLGRLRLYGSYATKSMFERGVDLTPYNFGFRLTSRRW